MSNKRNIIYIIIFLSFGIQVYSNPKIEKLEKELVSVTGGERVSVLLELAAEYQIIDFDKSFKYNDEAIEISKNLNSNILLAKSLATLAKTYEYFGNAERGYNLYCQALYYLKQEKGNNAELHGLIYKHLSNQHLSFKNNKDSAKYYKDKAIKIYQENSDYSKIADINIDCAYYWLNRKNHKKSNALFNAALKSIKKQKNDSLTASKIILISEYYRHFQQYEKALKLLLNNYYYFDKSLSRDLQQKYFYFVALYKWYLNDFYNSIEFCRKSLLLAKNVKSQESKNITAYTYELLGIIYTTLKLWDDANENYIEAIKYAENLHDRMMLTKMKMNRGTLFLNWQKTEEALNIFEDIKSEFRIYFLPNNKFAYTYFLVNLSECYFRLKNIDSLQKVLDNVTEIYPENTNNDESKIYVNRIRIKLLYLQKKYKEAEKYLKEFIPDINLLSNNEEKLNLLLINHKVLFKLGRGKEAYLALLKYSNFHDSVKTNQKIQNIGFLQGKLESQKEITKKEIENKSLLLKEKENSFIIKLMIFAAAVLIILVLIVLRERAKSEKLLLNILPEKIAKRLKSNENYIAEKFNDVSIMFIDIAQFTKMSSGIQPERLVEILNDIFTFFDDLSEKHGLEKIKTIGDCYLAVAGLPTPRIDHVRAAADMALDVLRMTNDYKTEEGIRINFRIGIDCGPVVAGIIGRKKFTYDLWGDTVNMASRMEDFGIIGYAQVTDRFKNALERFASSSSDKYNFTDRGLLEIKGKGKMHTWLLEENK